MAEINVISRGGMSITSKTQGKKLQRQISLAQQIEPGRRMRWSDDVIPRSEIAGTKPPYVCPGCFIHTYSNNIINRLHIQ
jgi:hypothetical protein